MHALATHLSPLYKSLAPVSYGNQIRREREGSDCRLGFKPGQRPFASVTACIDFCAHAHRDFHNMHDGCTVVSGTRALSTLVRRVVYVENVRIGSKVVTLNKHRGAQKPDDEQLHVLPLYVIDESDEYGDKQAQTDKFHNGSVEMLSKYVPRVPCHRCVSNAVCGF